MSDESIDYTSPSYILQNISYQNHFEKFESISSDTRLRVIQNIRDQVCFYVACVLKAFVRAERAPTIVIYGAGFVGSTIIEALVDCGCSSLLRIFTRDETTIAAWKEKGIKSTTRFRSGFFADILILCANLASFSQFCRDMSPHITPKTFVISSVFGLQRRRLFSILRTPGIFRVFVERKTSPSPDDSHTLPRLASPPPPSKSKTPTSPLSATSSVPLRRKNSRPGSPPMEKHPSSTHKLAPSTTADSSKMSPQEISARFLAGRKNSVRNLIIILENYFIISGIPAISARSEALDSIVGSESVLPATRLSSVAGSTVSAGDPPEDTFEPAGYLSQQSTASILSTGEVSDSHDGFSNAVSEENSNDDVVNNKILARQSSRRPAMFVDMPSHLKVIRRALGELNTKYCEAFKQELSRHILVIDLPTVQQDEADVRSSPLPKTRKNTRSKINRLPTRGIVSNPAPNWEESVLRDEKLLDIFKGDSVSSYLTDGKSEYLDEIDAESGDEDDGNGDTTESDIREQLTERYYIVRNDSIPMDPTRPPPMNLQRMPKSSFVDLALMGQK